MAKCIKIVRKYCDCSIGEIKDAIMNNKYVVERTNASKKDILLIIKLYKELCENQIKAELYEMDRKTSSELFNNLVESYNLIEKQTWEEIDQEVDE